MKKIICMILIAACLLNCAASCEAMDKRLSDVFDRCKASVVSMSMGNFTEAVTVLNTAVVSPERLGDIVNAKCPRLFGSVPQTEYAVAWREKSDRYLAVPVEVPSYKAAPCAIFKMNDNYEVLSVDFTDWADVTIRYAQSPEIRWNVEYIPDFFAVID